MFLYSVNAFSELAWNSNKCVFLSLSYNFYFHRITFNSTGVTFNIVALDSTCHTRNENWTLLGNACAKIVEWHEI